eukprot:CAMPEP_0114256904 /NCGR_PEP_ID=MMETSP0058-20121206/18429_1 /TAXON_ID=36894 /ORGANISM="Pyramimonas parkeae, CCMP726" /LENGTH=531 /DNA_ID=CAMNT_0001371557 /DNA_START=295 /DNA_END=1890 /DNA_ORIENTATION=-
MENNAERAPVIPSCGVSQQGERLETGSRGTGTGTGETVEEMIAREQRALNDDQAASLRASIGFFASQEEDVIERLRACPQYDSRQLDLDPELVGKLRELALRPSLLGSFMGDPRVMQAVVSLQGMAMDITSQDMDLAEQEGHARSAPAVTVEERQLAQAACSNAAEAKEAGNSLFKAGELRRALACYLLAVEMAPSELELPASFVPVVYGNIAQVYIKLKKYNKAEEACTEAIRTAPQEMNMTKIYFRRSLAREGQRRLEAALEDIRAAGVAAAQAVDDEVMRIKTTGGMLAKRQPFAQASVKFLQTEVTRLDAELQRLDALLDKARQAEISKKTERDQERPIEALRASGQLLSDVKLKNNQCKSSEGPTLPYSPGVIEEKDWSFWMGQRLASVLEGSSHWIADGGSIKILRLEKDASDIHASVKTKGGRRALYYDLDLHLTWEGVTKPTNSSITSSTEWNRTMGVLRLYNIGQDTQYYPGGDPGSSYMYSLGFDQRASGIWMEMIKDEAHELFHVASRHIADTIVELQRK